MLGRLPQTDGGYLGLDIEAFVSAVVSGAPGVFAAMLLQDAGIATDLVVRPGQRVSVSGDASRPRPPRWGDGGLAVQQRGSLSLSFVEVAGAFSASGGSLSLAQMAVTSAQLLTFSLGPDSVVRLSEVTVTDSGPETGALTGSVIWGADGVVVYDPPASLPRGLVRSPPHSYHSLVRSSHAQRRWRQLQQPRGSPVLAAAQALTGPARARGSAGVARQLHAQRVRHCGALRGVPPGGRALCRRRALWERRDALRRRAGLPAGRGQRRAVPGHERQHFLARGSQRAPRGLLQWRPLLRKSRDLGLELATFTFAAGCGGLRVE